MVFHKHTLLIFIFTWQWQRKCRHSFVFQVGISNAVNGIYISVQIVPNNILFKCCESAYCHPIYLYCVKVWCCVMSIQDTVLIFCIHIPVDHSLSYDISVDYFSMALTFTLPPGVIPLGSWHFSKTSCFSVFELKRFIICFPFSPFQRHFLLCTVLEAGSYSHNVNLKPVADQFFTEQSKATLAQLDIEDTDMELQCNER